MKPRQTVFNVLCAASIGLSLATSASSALAELEISGSAFVQPDSSLRISGTLVHLYGIYVPPTDETCYTFIRPVPCGPRASLALDFKISGDFVHCLPRATNPDGSVTASCTSGSDDLSEWMLQRGWAVARPEAPFEYAAMERIAQSKGIGIWGLPVDVIRRK